MTLGKTLPLFCPLVSLPGKSGRRNGFSRRCRLALIRLCFSLFNSLRKGKGADKSMGWIGEEEDGQWWKKVPVLLLSRKSASLLSLGLVCGVSLALGAEEQDTRSCRHGGRPCAGSGLGLARFRPRAVRQGLAKRLAEADFGVWAKRRRGGGEHRHVSAGMHRVVTRLTPVTRLEATCSRSGDPESLGVGPGDPTPAPRAGVSVGFGSTDAVPPPLLTNEDRLFLPQVPPSRGKLFSAGE